jgi:hypothetical protein
VTLVLAKEKPGARRKEAQLNFFCPNQNILKSDRPGRFVSIFPDVCNFYSIENHRPSEAPWKNWNSAIN